MSHPHCHAPSRATPVRLLAGFAREDRRQFLATGQPVQVACREPFMEEGDRDLNLYLILAGSVSAWRGGVRVAALGAGEVLNETKIFLPRPNQLSAMAETDDTAVLRLPRGSLLAFFRDRPERLLKVFVLNIVAILDQKLERREDSIVSGMLPPVPAVAPTPEEV